MIPQDEALLCTLPSCFCCPVQASWPLMRTAASTYCTPPEISRMILPLAMAMKASQLQDFQVLARGALLIALAMIIAWPTHRTCPSPRVNRSLPADVATRSGTPGRGPLQARAACIACEIPVPQRCVSTVGVTSITLCNTLCRCALAQASTTARPPGGSAGPRTGSCRTGRATSASALTLRTWKLWQRYAVSVSVFV